MQIGTELVEVGEDYKPEPRQTDWRVMPDINPYTSMIDGSTITSRSRHREHLRAHGCIEVGNDSSLYRTPQPAKPPPGLKETLIRAADMCLKRRD